MDFSSESEDGTSLGLPNDATRKGEKKVRLGGGEAGERRAIGDWGRNVSVLVWPSASLYLEEALLPLSVKILALLRLSVNFFQLRLTKKLKINSFVSKN